MAFPFGGYGSEVFVVEALVVGSNAGVDDGDDEVGAKVGLFEEAGVAGGFEAEELRGASGVEVAASVGEEGEDVGVGAEGGGLGWRERGGEAVEDGGVGVENGGGCGGVGGGEERAVPVSVSGEDGGFGVWVDKDDEGFGFGSGCGGGEGEEEEEEEREGERRCHFWEFVCERV